MAASELDIKVEVDMESLSRQIFEQAEWLKELNDKMSTITATHRHTGAPRVPSQPNEEFSLSELDYDELLDTYGSDPVLMTIFNRMREFFGQVPPEHWVKIKDWPYSGTSTTNPYWSVKWDPTTFSTTSTVSEPFTVKYDASGSYSLSPSSTTIRYTIEEE